MSRKTNNKRFVLHFIQLTSRTFFTQMIITSKEEGPSEQFWNFVCERNVCFSSNFFWFFSKFLFFRMECPDCLNFRLSCRPGGGWSGWSARWGWRWRPWVRTDCWSSDLKNELQIVNDLKWKKTGEKVLLWEMIIYNLHYELRKYIILWVTSWNLKVIYKKNMVLLILNIWKQTEK